jgi:hypothetical protein
MNEKELTLILEALKTLTDDAKVAFIWYLASKFATSVLTDIVIAGMVITVSVIASRCFVKMKELDVARYR